MSILAALAKVGAIYAAKAAQKSKDVNAPKEIASAFSVDSPKQNGSTYSIDVEVADPVGIASAYEWGSGIHSTKKEKKKYPIKAKSANGELHFFWKERGKWFKGFELPFGHPGVEKRPYLVPTIEETKEEFKKILGQGFKAEILQGVNKIEVIEIK
jgi:hypothetical protein